MLGELVSARVHAAAWAMLRPKGDRDVRFEVGLQHLSAQGDMPLKREFNVVRDIVRPPC